MTGLDTNIFLATLMSSCTCRSGCTCGSIKFSVTGTHTMRVRILRPLLAYQISMLIADVKEGKLFRDHQNAHSALAIGLKRWPVNDQSPTPAYLSLCYETDISKHGHSNIFHYIRIVEPRRKAHRCCIACWPRHHLSTPLT